MDLSIDCSALACKQHFTVVAGAHLNYFMYIYYSESGPVVPNLGVGLPPKGHRIHCLDFSLVFAFCEILNKFPSLVLEHSFKGKHLRSL